MTTCQGGVQEVSAGVGMEGHVAGRNEAAAEARRVREGLTCYARCAVLHCVGGSPGVKWGAV